ncbi:MAG: glycosyltransferase family 9 protein [Pseudomonadales bacterium]|nr:glycosyltransferase family 9 protein [Pseudomonadales bacterium]
MPLLRSVQRAWPAARITWVIGKVEAKLMRLIPEVEFITVDKRSGLGALRELRAAMRGRSFDLLLHLQLALRASLVASCIPAPIKLGFDRARARELQWLFTNARIAPREREHVLDSFLGFATAVGVRDTVIDWNVPLPSAARAYADRLIPDDQPTLVISPCSSHRLRNWSVAGYAAVAEHAVRKHGMRVILVGGPSTLERETGAAIARVVSVPIIDQIGADTLPELLALLARATALLSPDSGPAHMATMVGTPVLGLYAATNPARSGPYHSRQWCVDRYDAAARQFLRRPAAELAWSRKIELPGVMDLITADAVCAKLDQLLAWWPEADLK